MKLNEINIECNINLKHIEDIEVHFRYNFSSDEIILYHILDSISSAFLNSIQKEIRGR